MELDYNLLVGLNRAHVPINVVQSNLTMEMADFESSLIQKLIEFDL